MRIKLTLRPATVPATVPINYQYLLSAAIYKILRTASPAYAAFLHDRGYKSNSGKLMKLFTFSRLENPFAHIHKRGSLITLASSKGNWTLLIGSPMLEDFVQSFVLGLFETAKITVAGLGVRTTLLVEQVETLAPPLFADTMCVRTLSPVSVSTPVERNGKLLPQYLMPGDARLSEALQNNLIEKHQIIYAELPPEASLHIRFPGDEQPRSRLITIKEGSAEETRRRGFEGRFTLQGSPELMRTAWECGLGEAGAMGFGMVEVERVRR